MADSLTAWELLKETFKEWNEDRAPRLAAALAYYTIFALAPLLLIAIAVAALVFDEAQVRQTILEELGRLIGPAGRQAVEALIEGARRPAAGRIATAVGLATLLVAAGGLFGQLQDALNTIWQVQPEPGRGLWGIVKDRLLSFALVFGAGLLLLASLVLGVTLDVVGRLAGGDAYGKTLLWQALNTGLSFGLTALLFAMIFKVLPDAKVRWRDVWIGALATAVLFSLGRFLIGLYLERAATESVYGAAGSLVALLIWVYYSAQILFLGAEFTKVYARTHGGPIEPSDHAVRAKAADRARQGMSGHRAGEENAAEVASRIAAGSIGPQRSRSTSLAPIAGAVGGFVFGLLLGRRRS